ncbi:homeodomain mating-type protein [Moniliophthora roreri MCA 2997]|uniref:Homeodomain mating-type protein n=2 Tax=Moniliophthora roreri TaxID=221103 RepID=V2WMN9_MONRO|nr:homeodomain transcription factor HD1.2 [Moniliophthora roreri]ESK81811.1 homeodomain mating-type protein [Moniliophthora roreri MCA 2997]
MDSSTSLSLQDRLRLAVDDFFTSYEDPAQVDSFSAQWNTLHSDMTAAFENGSIDMDQSHLALNVANCIEELCDAFMSLNQINDAFDLHNLSSPSDDPSSTPGPQRQPSSSRSSSSPEPQPHQFTPEPEESPISSSPYVRAAYEWLIENLHNPYPTPVQRDAISLQSGTSRKTIDNWFIDVRKRIGWNAIKKQYFKERKEMVLAARLHFGHEVDESELPKKRKEPEQAQSLGLAFAGIEAKALELYGGRLRPSDFVEKLAGQVKTSTPEIKGEVEKEKREERLKRRRVGHKREVSSSSSISDEVVVQAVPTPAPVAGQKRRADSDEQEVESSSKKRQRPEEPAAEDRRSRSPSPAATLSDNDSSAPSLSSSQPEPDAKKRRLVSDSDASPRAAKRSRMAQPIGRAASVPITLPAPKFPIEEWFTRINPPPTAEQWPENRANFTFGTTEYYSDIETLLSDGSDSGLSTGPSTPAASGSSELPNVGIAPSDTTLSTSMSYDKTLNPTTFDTNINFTDLYLLKSLSNGISVVDPNAAHLFDSYSGAQQSSNSLSGLDGLGLDFTNFMPDSWSTELISFEGLDTFFTDSGCVIYLRISYFILFSCIFVIRLLTTRIFLSSCINIRICISLHMHVFRYISPLRCIDTK